MRPKRWLILISILFMTVGGGFEFPNPQASARHIHHARRSRVRHRTQIKMKRIPANVYPHGLLYYSAKGRTGYTNGYFNRHRFQPQMSKNYINAVVKNEYQAINQARHSIHERSVITNQNLNHLAQWRAKQASQRFTHYDRKGRPLAWQDAAKMRLGSYTNARKNIGENMFYVGKLSQMALNNGLAGYYFSNPKDLADDNVFDSLNNDAADQWSHGENIMMPQHRYIGIGTYYRRSNHGLYVLVEFSSKRPVVHKK